MKKVIQNNMWGKTKNKTQNNLSNQIAIHNEEKKSCACMLRLHDNETRMFVLRIFLCFSQHIVNFQFLYKR